MRHSVEPDRDILSTGHWERLFNRYFLRFLVDGLLVVVAYYCALGARFIGQVPPEYTGRVGIWTALVASIYIVTNIKWRIYNRLWRYATPRDVVALIEASIFATLVVFAADLLLGNDRPLPLSQILIGGSFSGFLMLAARSRYLLLYIAMPDWRMRSQPETTQERALIVGAGDHGRRLAQHLRDDLVQKKYYSVVGFIDDDRSKTGLILHGLPILGTRRHIPALVKEHGIDQIIIASRTPFGDSFHELVDICQGSSAQIKVLPRFYDLLEQGDHHPELRDLTIEDLLDRKPACIDRQTCRKILEDRVIMVTGAAGSIGSELCRQILQFNPAELLAIDNNETGLFDLQMELSDIDPMGKPSELHFLVGDITNLARMAFIFDCYRPQIVFHTAAYKHVPMMESHPGEAIRVNVFGTVTVSDLAAHFGVDRFLNISTDKAVNPSSVMGATKRIGELWITALQQGSKTRYASVRFGNVVNSRGSVVPIFNRQIERGGPVTVTDPRMTRYFMSIPEAATLIIQAGSFAQGGEVYMLDMGQPIRIVDLAQKMIRLRGLRLGTDMQIKFTGMRPGEKLHEELSYETECKYQTVHPKIYSLNRQFVPDKVILRQQIELLCEVVQNNANMDVDTLRQGIMQLACAEVDDNIPTFISTSSEPQERRLMAGWSVLNFSLPALEE